jgi:hypothetical protein
MAANFKKLLMGTWPFGRGNRLIQRGKATSRELISDLVCSGQIPKLLGMVSKIMRGTEHDWQQIGLESTYARDQNCANLSMSSLVFCMT